MSASTPVDPQAAPGIPPDDPARLLTVARADDPDGEHLAVAGDVYTVLVSGAQTAGRYCLIDMVVPPGGGPPPHRHDFEEMFTLLEGELAFTFRGKTQTVGAGATVNIPANAPHMFKNVSKTPAHMLCLCAPSGQEQFFAAVGVPVASRTTPPPVLNANEQAEKRALMQSLLPRFRTEMVQP